MCSSDLASTLRLPLPQAATFLEADGETGKGGLSEAEREALCDWVLAVHREDQAAASAAELAAMSRLLHASVPQGWEASPHVGRLELGQAAL